MSRLIETKKGDLLFEQYDLKEIDENFPDLTFAVGCYYVKNGMKKSWHVHFPESARTLNFEVWFDEIIEAFPHFSEDFKAGAFYTLLNIRRDCLK